MPPSILNAVGLIMLRSLTWLLLGNFTLPLAIAVQLNRPGARIMALEFAGDASKTRYFWCDPLCIRNHQESLCPVAAKQPVALQPYSTDANLFGRRLQEAKADEDEARVAAANDTINCSASE